jgi:hypothetical protein
MQPARFQRQVTALPIGSPLFLSQAKSVLRWLVMPQATI